MFPLWSPLFFYTENGNGEARDEEKSSKKGLKGQALHFLFVPFIRINK